MAFSTLLSGSQLKC